MFFEGGGRGRKVRGPGGGTAIIVYELSLKEIREYIYIYIYIYKYIQDIYKIPGGGGPGRVWRRGPGPARAPPNRAGPAGQPATADYFVYISCIYFVYIFVYFVCI